MTATHFREKNHTAAGVLPCIVLMLMMAPPARAAEYFAAPNAKPLARGTREDPFDLAAALSATRTIRAGDTLWLLGGTYRGAFVSQLQGLKDKPVTIRQAPGERATIDCRSSDGKGALFYVKGDWSTFQGFEVTCSNPKRSTQLPGSWPSDLNRGGIDCRAAHVKFINLVVRDTAGFGLWSDGEGGEIYGCLIFNNGWQSPNRANGHGIYAQNELGVKRLVDNILFNQFAYGIHCYGSGKASLKRFHIEGNFSFNNGSLSQPEDRSSNLHVGGECPVGGVRIVANVVYSDRASSGIRLGYPWGTSNADAVVKDNYVVGQVYIKQFDALTYSGNTVIGKSNLVQLEVADGQEPSKYEWRRNVYVSSEQRYPPFTLVRDGHSTSHAFGDWRDAAGVDAESTYSESEPTGVKVFIRPNRYQPGRANIAVVNWDRRPEIELDLSKVLSSGQSFRIVSAQDFYGEPILSGTYDGKLVQLPMKPTPAQRAVGLESRPLPITEPEFGVFVVLSD